MSWLASLEVNIYFPLSLSLSLLKSFKLISKFPMVWGGGGNPRRIVTLQVTCTPNCDETKQPDSIGLRPTTFDVAHMSKKRQWNVRFYRYPSRAFATVSNANTKTLKVCKDLKTKLRNTSWKVRKSDFGFATFATLSCWSFAICIRWDRASDGQSDLLKVQEKPNLK